MRRNTGDDMKGSRKFKIYS